MNPWVTLAIGVGAIALGAWMLTRRRAPAPLVTLRQEPPTSAPRAIPLVDVPSEAALDALPRPIRACPECGYLGLRAPSVSEGGLPAGEMLSSLSCPHCGYAGPPAEFETGVDYQEYVEALRRSWRKRG